MVAQTKHFTYKWLELLVWLSFLFCTCQLTGKNIRKRDWIQTYGLLKNCNKVEEMTVISKNREDNWPKYILPMKNKARVKEILIIWHTIIVVLKFVMTVFVSRTGLLTPNLIVFSVSFCEWGYMPGIFLHIFCGSESFVKTLISKVWRAQRICSDSNYHCPTIYLAS